jgi:protein arginine N-methyltransferase 1
MTVVDVGTGPYALLALVAARAGAKKVFAVEVNAAAAARARLAVAAATDVPPGVVEVVEGFSTAVTLPYKVDLFIGEVVGNMASEEGIVSTVGGPSLAAFARARESPRPFFLLDVGFA